MRILGISAYYHDSAAALVQDGEILAASQEERFSRLKHDARFPRQAVKDCLERFPGPLDAVVYYEKPLLKFERILRTAAEVAPRGFRGFSAAIPDWIKGKLWVPLQIEKELERLGHDVTGKVRFANHHQAHAASAFFPSPFAEAAFLTLDGVGEWSTTTFGRGSGERLEFLGELRYPDSLGLLYSAFTYYCGFRVNSGEYKLMGLAPYGEPVFRKRILEHLVDIKEDGSFSLDQRYFSYSRGDVMIHPRFEALFGGVARTPEEPVLQRHCDLARSIQVVTEELVVRMAKHVRAVTGLSRLCLAGGVALNCVANGRLLREGIFEDIWVQPAAGDAGGALGAALAYGYEGGFWKRSRGKSVDDMKGALLGPEFDEQAIRGSLEAAGLPFERINEGLLHGRVAQRLAAGAVVGYFQGRGEFGPRALGNRSILADARNPAMQRQLNLKIKFRESFRPFAPIVLKECAKEYFELTGESPYMLVTAPVLANRRLALGPEPADLRERASVVRSDIPAVTHVDGSARIQTVDKMRNPALHDLLRAFERLTGCPVLINTSFNVRGEPPVCRPSEAIEGFLETEMDALVIGPFIVEKSAISAQRLSSVQRREFKPD